jgi:hypothetical protein
MSKVSIQSQIAALDAFIDRNCIIEPGEKGRLHRDHVKAARETLIFVKENEQGFRDYIAAKRQGGLK